MKDFITLDYGDVAMAAALVLINAGLSIWLQLGLERRLLIAAVRMVVQLSLIGLVLQWLFALVSPLWTATAAVLMVLFAGREAMARQERRFSGWWGFGLGTTSMLMASLSQVPPSILTICAPACISRVALAMACCGVV